MGRGVSSGGGQSSLGYLFGGGETPNKPQSSQKKGEAANKSQAAQNNVEAANNSPPQTNAIASKPIDKDIPAGINGTQTNNYFRAEGQNCGNFLTDRPSTKVHAAPGGGSSLGYLFGGSNGGGN